MEAMAEMEQLELDDTDLVDPEEEEAAWKIRELLRIKRDREQREYRLVDAEDIERRRNMTDDQIASENRSDGKLDVEKKSLRFMQKYYHKGAFYSGDAEVEAAMQNVDASAPTLEDHADKLVMPDIMKVKNFGKRGRTKYTHLVDQDTTGLDIAWAKTENTSQRVMSQMGGMKQGFDHPSKKARNK
ncbi:Microfibrillar-associated protein 1 [Kappamyces sp. JEL0680]|nr:Microfibrillar-associated protein 1 [Kappamyces sp. JEL0680]